MGTSMTAWSTRLKSLKQQIWCTKYQKKILSLTTREVSKTFTKGFLIVKSVNWGSGNLSLITGCTIHCVRNLGQVINSSTGSIYLSEHHGKNMSSQWKIKIMFLGSVLWKLILYTSHSDDSKFLQEIQKLSEYQKLEAWLTKKRQEKAFNLWLAYFTNPDWSRISALNLDCPSSVTSGII